MNGGADFTTSPWIVLTGAGASVPLGKDTTSQFVTRCLEKTGSRYLLEQVLAATKTRTALPEVDIEMVLDYLVELTSAYDILKSDKQLGPIVSQVPKASDLSLAGRIGTPLAESGGVRLAGLDGGILDFLNSPDYLIGQRKELREELLGFIVDHYCEVDGEAALAFYNPIFKTQANQPSIPIFTLNYDDAIEAAVDASNDLELVDGFEPGKSRPKWLQANFELLGRTYTDKRRIFLFKLHGSTTWGRHKKTRDIIRLPASLQKDPGAYEHVIMYPSQTKLGLEGEPFATAYTYLAECLENTRCCLVIGTSFRDREINQVFQNALRHSPKLQLVVVGPDVDESQLAKTLRCEKTRIQPILGEFGDPAVGDNMLDTIQRF